MFEKLSFLSASVWLKKLYCSPVVKVELDLVMDLYLFIFLFVLETDQYYFWTDRPIISLDRPISGISYHFKVRIRISADIKRSNTG